MAFIDAGLVRQVAVLAADDEHAAELQALGRMQAHQPHLVARLAAVGVRQQGQLRGQFAGPGRPALGFEPLREFVEVLLAAQEQRLVLALRSRSAASMPDSFDERAHEFGRRAAVRSARAVVHDSARELGQAGRRGAALSALM